MLVIVGHGPSMKGSGLGAEIDLQDCPIVRFNGFMHGCGVEDRGDRVDYICTTTYQFRRFVFDGVVPTREVWVYNTNDYFKHVDRYKGPLYKAELKGWLEIYRSLMAKGKSRKFCKGMAAIIIAAERLRPSSIHLFGFDNLWRGESTNFSTLGTSRDKGVYTTKHDYAAERKMVDIVAGLYSVNIFHMEF